MSIFKIKSFLYWLARLLGDLNALSKGPKACNAPLWLDIFDVLNV